MEDADLREKVAHLEEREKSNTHRIDEHDKQIRKLSVRNERRLKRN